MITRLSIGITGVKDKLEQKIFASEFSDDYYAIPAYEQIYALAGPVQTYRIAGDSPILNDARLTVRLFDRFFRDRSEYGGYFSHLDPVTLDPHSEALGDNKGKKNWNSIGDHAPAYLINLWLATGEQKYFQMLENTCDTIVKRFPDYGYSPFVQERFYADWSPDRSWGWQQDRAVVGHNLKIPWNLMRMYNIKPKSEYLELACKIADLMPEVGSDRTRGGWYDVVERRLKNNESYYRFVWHDRKAWWQQEQAILAYLILAGSLGNSEYQRLDREASAFYNAWFLDNDAGGIYFNVLANGLPYLLGNKRAKGSHSMSGYHSFELAYLATVYTNLLITKHPMDLYFKPKPQGFKDNILRVAPDILPPGSIRIDAVWINGQSYFDFDANALTVQLPSASDELKVRIRVIPTKVAFDAMLLEVTDGTAKMSLIGVLDATAVPLLMEELDKVTTQPIKPIVLLLQNLNSIDSAGLRSLIFTKQKLGNDFEIYAGASEKVPHNE